MFSFNNSVKWDPVESNLDSLKNIVVDESLEDNVSTLFEYPYTPTIKFIFLLIPGLILSSISAFLFLKGDMYMSIQFGSFAVLYLMVSPILYLLRLERLKSDCVRLFIVKTRKWIYNDQKDIERWEKLYENFPEIFEVKEVDFQGFMKHQFWGNYKNENFFFGVNSGRYIFAFKFNLESSIGFFLQGKSKKDITKGLSKNSEVQTEFIKFNEAFDVRFAEKLGFIKDNDLFQMDVMKSLTPKVQEILLKFYKEFDDERILFRKGVIIFSFKGIFTPTLHSKFFPKFNVNKKDIQEFDKRLDIMIKTKNEIVRYMN